MVHLFDFLFPPRPDQALIRDVSVDIFLHDFSPRSVPTTPETIALLPFSLQVVRATIHEAKYHGSTHAFELLGSALSEYLRDADEGFRKPAIVPVPLGKKRYKERGYNQAEETALRASKELGIPVENLLTRTRETVSQVSLAREARKENMRGAFRLAQGATHPLSPTRTYIVIDDVITTGATLQSAIDALKEAGAEHVVSIALAH
jgi:ComF family protein